MCGICGFVGAGQQNVIDSMLGAMAYRGPDGDGYWTDEQQPLDSILGKIQQERVFPSDVYQERMLH